METRTLFQLLEEEHKTVHGSLPERYVKLKEELQSRTREAEEHDEALVKELFRYLQRPLFRMLEEEYVVLHGPLPDAYNRTKKEKIQTAKSLAELNEALVGELYRCILEQSPTALCLSGGGIRSATFGLGILQGLARHDLLDQFHYLSTVSGGGYVGSWLTSWIHRKGFSAVVAALKNPPQSALNPEPPQIRHLRDYSNYLTPQTGLLSGDTWTLVATYLRNLFVNWLVWLPLLLATLMLPRLLITVLAYKPSDHPWLTGGAFAVGSALVVLSIAYTCLNLPSVREELKGYRHFLRNRTSQESFLIWCLIPLLGSAFFLTTAWAWLRNPATSVEGALQATDPWAPLPLFVLFGIAVHVLGWLLAILLLVRVGSRWRLKKSLWAIRAFRSSYSRCEAVAILISGAVGGALVWVLAVKVFPNPTERLDAYICFAAPLLLALPFLTGGSVYVGLASHWTTDEDREWWARSSAWMLIALVAWSVACMVVAFGPALFMGEAYGTLLSAVGGLSGLLALLFGFSAKTAAKEGQSDKRGWATLVVNYFPLLAAPIAIVCLGAVLSLLTSWLIAGIPGMVSLAHGASLPIFSVPYAHVEILHHTHGWRLALLTVLLTLFAGAMAWLINVNRFSLHSIYRNRLIRAYLGASNERRNPNAFTGFDPNDNIQMHELLSRTSPPTFRPKLFHVVNIALNLVQKRKEKLAWQERKAESLTVSPLHVGNRRLGYRCSEEYGQNQKNKAITLGTAISISGAAASPNMGYHSSPAVTFLMTLFNVRLGWWLGNPGQAGAKTFMKSSPDFAVVPMIQEALGFTNDEYPYVYLSDGGHFENLGLYEMVLRRCRFILAIDSGRDPECAFEDLGNAIRKVRIDLGVPIQLQRIRIYSPKSKRQPGDIPKYCAIGTIEYSRIGNVEDGTLIYLKPALCEDEPADILNYAQTNPGFPHESTNDQWFSESQFESYRMLGSHIMNQICDSDWSEADFKKWQATEKNRGKSKLDYFAFRVQRYLDKKPDSQAPTTVQLSNGDGTPEPGQKQAAVEPAKT